MIEVISVLLIMFTIQTSETPLDDICPELLIPSLGHYFLSDPSQHELIFQTKKFPELSLVKESFLHV